MMTSDEEDDTLVPCPAGCVLGTKRDNLGRVIDCDLCCGEAEVTRWLRDEWIMNQGAIR